MKLPVSFSLFLIQVGCVQRAAQSVPKDNAALAPSSHPRLSRIAAIRLAERSPAPDGYDRSAYRFSGTANYFAHLRQWAIGYEPKRFSGMPGDHFIVWIDDATGRFIRFGYGR